MNHPNPAPTFNSFSEFYPFYLAEHSDPLCRRLHFVGSSASLAMVAAAIIFKLWLLLPLAVVTGYAFAWVGHYVFEKNRPATFRYPGYSLLGDCRMWWETLTGKIRL